jgi:hypothetical protein
VYHYKIFIDQEEKGVEVWLNSGTYLADSVLLCENENSKSVQKSLHVNKLCVYEIMFLLNARVLYR